MIRTIPLNKLVPSPRNVRRSTDEQADLQLKADIEARGLLQNLVVTSVVKARGSFAVEAGGRRLKALQRLAAEGKLPKGHEVCCLVIEDGPAAAQEASLAENFQRLSMNPADECIAFGQLIEQGSDVEGIARRFGLTVRFVEGRLRLAGLAPIVFEALGAGAISLDVAKAYAATPDRERQAWVYEQLGQSYAANHPDSIRRMMTQATASGSDRRARLVGEEAYVAAGGRIERDLFSDDGATRWLDVPLLERLAAEKMEALAAETAAELGLAWVRPTLESWVGADKIAGLRRIVPQRMPLTHEEAARVEEAQGEIEVLVAVIDDEDVPDATRDKAEGKISALEEEIETLSDRRVMLDEALKPSLGAFLLLGEDGKARLDSVFYAETAPQTETAAAGEHNSGPQPLAAESHDRDEPPTLPRVLVDELAMQRRDILAVHVAADTGLALDLAIFLMVEREAGYAAGSTGSSLSATAPSDPVLGFKTPRVPATVARIQATEALDRSWTEADTRAEQFDAFRALPEEVRAAWLGHAVARTLQASCNVPGARTCAFHDHLARLLGIDVAGWWRPTGANFFDRVPKSVTLAAFEEIGGPAFAARYAKAKKAELCEAAERIFAGEFSGEAEVKERALAWVPEAMRFAPAASPVDQQETPPWEDEPALDVPAPGEEAHVDEHPDAAEPNLGSGGNADALLLTAAPEESGGGDAGVDGAEPSERIEEAA